MSVAEPPDHEKSAIAGKVIVCDVLPIEKLCVTCGAGL